MPEDTPPPRQPQRIERFMEDSVHMTDSVQMVVGHAQAQIATAIGQAHDATVRIEELRAAATTPEEHALAAQLAAEFAASVRSAWRDEFAPVVETLEGIRSDNTESGKSATRYSRASLVIGGVGCLIGVIGVVLAALVAFKVIP
jgi:hypothetical protein